MATTTPTVTTGEPDTPTAGIAELKPVLREALESRGVTGQLKARIRAEIFNVLDEQSEPKPPLPHENLLINELIRDYLEFNRYRYTCSVLLAESGQPKEPLGREFLAQEMNIACDETTSGIPLLYRMLAHFISTAKKADTHSRCTTRHTHTHRNQKQLDYPDEDLDLTSLPQAPEPLVVKGGK